MSDISSDTNAIEESALSSSVSSKDATNIEDKVDANLKNDNKCYICNKKFGLARKYYCKYCENSVCSRHSFSLKENQGKIRICDACDIEITKTEIKAEIQEELSKLQDNIKIAREGYEKVEAERLEKAKIVRKLEEELKIIEKTQKKEEEDLNQRLNDELIKAQALNQSIDDTRKELEESHDLEKDFNDKCLKNKQKIEDITLDIQKIKEKKSELLCQLEYMTTKIKASLPIDQVIPNLCDKCKNKISTNFKYKTTESIKELDESIPFI
jgi:DNA repair exonuclease SbcCD ATPase subunit